MAKDKNKQELNVFTPVEQMIDGKSPAYYPNSISPFPPPEWETYGYDKVEEEDNKIHLRDIWRKIRKHKLLIFSIVTIITTVVAIQVFRTKPWYSSSAVIEVRKENSMVLKSGEVTLNDDADPYFLVNVNTKMLALNNRELFEEVVVDQKLDQNPEIVALIEKKSLFSFLESSKKESAAPTNVAKTSQQTDGTTRTLEETHRLQPYVDYLEKNLNFEQVKTQEP